MIEQSAARVGKARRVVYGTVAHLSVEKKTTRITHASLMIVLQSAIQQYYCIKMA